MLAMQVLSSGPLCREHLVDLWLPFLLPFLWFFSDFLFCFLDLFFSLFSFPFFDLFFSFFDLLFFNFFALFLLLFSFFFLAFLALVLFLLFLFSFFSFLSFFTPFPGDLAILLRTLTSSGKLDSFASSAEKHFVEH